MAGAYNAGTAHVNILPKMTQFQPKLRAELKKVPSDHTIDIKAGTAGFSERVRAAIKDAPDSKTVLINADTKVAEQKIEKLTKTRRTSVDVDATTAKARTEIARLEKPRKTKLIVDADTSKAQRATGVFSGNMKTLDRYQKRLALVSSGYTLLGISAAGTIGPISGLTGVLVQMSGVLVTLPATLGAAMAGIAGLGIGMSGIMGAFGAIGQSAGGAAADIGDSARDAERDIIRAKRGVRDAERNLTDAQKDAQKAQRDLNKERKQAARDLEDLNDQLNDAALNEESATLAVARARQRLQETLADKNSSQLDIAEADLGYREAVNDLEDLRRENNRLAEDTLEANKKGIEGSDGVVAAQEQIQETQYRVLTATEALEEAQWGLEEAYDNAAKGAQDAAGGTDAFADAMAKLSPNAREFVRAIMALGPAWRELRWAAQDALFEGMGESVTKLANRQLPVLKDGLVGLNTEMNRGIRTGIAEFSTELSALEFGVFFENTRRGMAGLASSVRPLSRMWMDLNVVGAEYLPRMGRAIEDVTNKWSNQIMVARHTGDLNRIIDNGIAAWGRSLRALRDVGGIAIGTFGAAATATNPFTSAIAENISQTNQWVNSFDGQTQIGSFFKSTTQTLADLMPVAKALGGVIVGGLVPAVQSLVANIGPGVTKWITAFGESFGTTLPLIDKFGKAIGGAFEDWGNTMEVLSPLVTAVTKLGEAFLSLPQPILTAIAAFAVAKWLGIGKVFDKIKESATTAGGTFNTLGKTMSTSFRESSLGLRVLGGANREYSKSLTGMANITTYFKGAMQTTAGYAKGGFSAAITGAMGVAKKGFSGIMNLLGGPWGLALMAATAAVTVLVDSFARAKEAQKNIAADTRDITQAYGDLAVALDKSGGLIDGDAIAAQARIAKGELTEFINTGAQLQGLFSSMKGVSEMYYGMDTGIWGTLDYNVQGFAQQLKKAHKQLEEEVENMGYTMDDLYGIIAEGGPEYDHLIAKMYELGDSGELNAQQLEAARQRILDVTSALQSLSPEVLAAEGIFAQLAGSTEDAATKADKLRYAYMELTGFDVSAFEATARATEEIARLDEKIRRAAEGTNEFAGAMLDAEGNLDGTNRASIAVQNELQSIASALQTSVGAGNDANEEFARFEGSLEALRVQSGLSKDKWDELLASFGMTPDTLTIVAELAGADEIEQRLGILGKSLKTRFDGTTFTTDAVFKDEGARDRLREIFGDDNVKVLNEDAGTIELTVDDQQAVDTYNWWIEEGFPELDLSSPTASVNIDDTGFLLKTDAAKLQLQQIDKSRPNPLAGMDITKLSAEQLKALQDVGLLDGMTPTPEAGMTIGELEDEQQLALSKVFDLDAETPTPVADLDPRRLNNEVDKAEGKLLGLTTKEWKVVLNATVDKFTGAIDTAKTKLKELSDAFKDYFNMSNEASSGKAGVKTSQKAGLYSGGQVPTSGPGSQEIDGFLGVDDSGRPQVRVHAGEYVVNEYSTRKHRGLIEAINNDTLSDDDVPGLYNGGIVESMEQYVGNFNPALLTNGKAYSGLRFSDNGYHSVGQAADFSNGGNAGTPEMTALAQHIYKNFKDQTLELIHWPLNGFRNIKNYQDFDYDAGTNEEHRNHVHWALAAPLNPVPQEVLNVMDSIGGPSTLGLNAYIDSIDTTDPLSAVDSGSQLEDFRNSIRSDPNAYDATSADDLPTTWTGLAKHIAEPMIEGHTQDLLGLLGLSDDLPGAVKAYNLYTETNTNRTSTDGMVDAYSNAQTTLANDGAPTSYVLDFDLPTQDMASTIPVTSHVYNPALGVEQWRPLSRVALQRHGYNPDPYIDAMMKQIEYESSGDPNSINLWDSNAKIGTPSGGLLHVIEPTYQDVRRLYPEPFAGLPDDRMYPLTNLVAGIGALRRDWGGPEGGRWPTRDGYATGGFVTGMGGATDDLITAQLSHGEFVQNALTTAVSRPLQEAMNNNPGFAQQLNQMFTNPNTAATTAQGVHIHYEITVTNQNEGMRIAEMHARQQSAAYL